MALPHRSDSVGLHKLDDTAIVVTGVNLRSHLSGHASLHGGFTNNACFVHIVCQRFFAIHVFAQLKGRQCGEGMGMFTGADNDRVKLVGMIEQFAEVRRRSRVRKLLCGHGPGSDR